MSNIRNDLCRLDRWGAERLADLGYTDSLPELDHGGYELADRTDVSDASYKRIRLHLLEEKAKLALLENKKKLHGEPKKMDHLVKSIGSVASGEDKQHVNADSEAGTEAEEVSGLEMDPGPNMTMPKTTSSKHQAAPDLILHTDLVWWRTILSAVIGFALAMMFFIYANIELLFTMPELMAVFIFPAVIFFAALANFLNDLFPPWYRYN